MTIRRSLLLAVAAVALATPAAAQVQLLPNAGDANDRLGTRGAAFLLLGVDARGAALGGSVAADVRGVPALYWNTAGIAFSENGRIGASINELFGDFGIRLNHVGAIMPIGDGAAGISVTFLTSGEMERTNALFPQGGDPLLGDVFTYTATAASLHYGRLLTDRLALGGAIRYVQEGIDGARAQFVGIDVGTQFNTGLWGTTVGAALTNVGTEGRFQGRALRARTSDGFDTGRNSIDVEPLASNAQMPTMFRFSIATDLVGPAAAILSANPQHSLRLLGDVADGISTPITSAIALEYGFRDMVYLRTGKRFHNEAGAADWSGSHGLGFGGGLRLAVGGSNLMLDYGYQPWGDLDNVQVFTLELAF